MPSLYPSSQGRTRLGTEAGIGVALRDFEAVILDKTGTFHKRYYRIYPGMGYSLVNQTDYNNIRDELIARAAPFN